MRIGDLTVKETALSPFTGINRTDKVNTTSASRALGLNSAYGMSRAESKKTYKMVITQRHIANNLIFLRTKNQNGLYNTNTVKKVSDVYTYLLSLIQPRTSIQVLFETETTKMDNGFYIIESIDFQSQQGDVNFSNDTFAKMEFNLNLMSTDPPRPDGFGLIQNEVIFASLYDTNTITADNLNAIKKITASIQNTMQKARQGLSSLQTLKADIINGIQDLKDLIDEVKNNIQDAKNLVASVEQTIKDLEKIVNNLIDFADKIGSADTWDGNIFDPFLYTAETLNENLSISQDVVNQFFFLNLS